jgi:hypothetical protein
LTKISTRDALLALRKLHAEDAENRARIVDLTTQLNDALDVRAARLEDALATLEDYVAYQSEAHGFNPILEDLVAKTKATKKTAKTAKKKAKKKVTKKKAKKKKKKVTKKASRTTVRQPRATGWQGSLDETISFSEREQRAIDLFVQQWPRFVSPTALVAKGIISVRNHASPLATQLRRKGVPIESAAQARSDDTSISDKLSGYRLIG